MEWQQVSSAVQNFGAMAILALMVYRSPSIINCISDLMQRGVTNVRDTQTEALNVFKIEQDKLLSLVSERFTSVETNLLQNVQAQTASLAELKNLASELKGLTLEVAKVSNRVEDLERGKSR